MATVVLNTSVIGTLRVKADPAIRWLDLETGELRGPAGPSFGAPTCIGGAVHPPVGAETDGFQISVDGRASFMLRRNVDFTPKLIPVVDSAALTAALAAANVALAVSGAALIKMTARVAAGQKALA